MSKGRSRLQPRLRVGVEADNLEIRISLHRWVRPSQGVCCYKDTDICGNRKERFPEIFGISIRRYIRGKQREQV